jgi:hypothetical protein
LKYKYLVEVLEFTEVHEIPDAWTNNDFKALLNHIEFDDVEAIPEDELKDMALMALSDLEAEEAAIRLLELRFGDKLSKGQRQNLSEELKEDRLWEEYADIRFHEEIFNVSCVLFQAFPKVYSEGDIVMIRIKVQAANPLSEANLRKPSSAFIARLLNDGMDDSNMIYRLFDDQINSNRFPEAEHIIWKFEDGGFSEEDRSTTFRIYTSWNWVEKLKGNKNYESNAFADGQLI